MKVKPEPQEGQLAWWCRNQSLVGWKGEDGGIPEVDLAAGRWKSGLIDGNIKPCRILLFGSGENDRNG